MILLLAFGLLLSWLILRRIKRKRALVDMQLRPYRYELDTRRTRFGSRGGF